MWLDKFLEQKRTPVFTAISCFTTVFVWILMMMALLIPSREWGGLAALGFSVIAPAVGTVVNLVAGVVSHARGEYRGGEVAAIGPALWIATWLSLGPMHLR